MWRRHRSVAIAILALGGSENSLAKTGRTREHFANTRNFDNVYTNGNDHK